jgi:hypothetical protein
MYSRAGMTEAEIHANGGTVPEEWTRDTLVEQYGTAKDIYNHLGETVLAESRVPSHGRIIIPESQPHARRQARLAETRHLGSLSVGQRSHMR